MTEVRATILDHLCYTELVYGRINKKLKMALNQPEIEKLMSEIFANPKNQIEKIGKNFYIKDLEGKIRVTINSYTYRVITADIIKD
ncbi:hypothetical protein M2139_002292 [Enterococcus sp. PF1-24]|uniref:DUF3781 domain-containing protein n=1 Tax=unclassified Enterococcus TaxID=2608891 RepID=UPI002473F7B5|nr:MULTISPECIES: DUF3781 domain-containing protein [unclassified Enterococcus]MDH6365279.1 hypothetical protein [Enterococcus sp. PFB1-1]MDH6402391.1 hypothetical protein [Enterococcus sp. PF1-24]